MLSSVVTDAVVVSSVVVAPDVVCSVVMEPMLFCTFPVATSAVVLSLVEDNQEALRFDVVAPDAVLLLSSVVGIRFTGSSVLLSTVAVD